MAKSIKIIHEEEFKLLDNSEKWITELYEEADRKTAEKFSKDSLAYKTITNGINTKNITGSQFFWNTILENDSRFAYSNNSKQIPFGKKQKTIYTEDNGLSGVFLNLSGLYARYDSLADSYDVGRVVLKDAEGVVASENLRDYTQKELKKYSELVREVKEGNLPNSKLEEVLGFFDKLKK